jgi:hypothetical protein
LFQGESNGLSLVEHLLTVTGVLGREHAAIVFKMHPFVALRQSDLLLPPLENMLRLLHFFRFDIALV